MLNTLITAAVYIGFLGLCALPGLALYGWRYHKQGKDWGKDET